MSTEAPRCLVVLPGTPGRSATIGAQWLAAADLGAALGRQLGGVEFLTPMGHLTAEQMERLAIRPGDEPSRGRSLVRSLPRVGRVAIGDAQALRRARALRRTAPSLSAGQYDLVLQFHARFHDVGRRIASEVGAPLVVRVEALEVREADAWGLRRPGWGRLVERWGEAPLLGAADLVVSVSDRVDDDVASLGIEPVRRAIVPNGVDIERFAPGPTDTVLRRSIGLADRFVVGWVGGFRPFHGLEQVPEIAERLAALVPGAVVCLVGTGPMRAELEELAAASDGVVKLLPPVPHDQVAGWIRAFDACLLLASSSRFHYSPLKLLEYQACGRPVVAARVGQVLSVVDDGVTGLLVPPGDPSATVAALRRLADDPTFRERLGAEARGRVVATSSWDARARQILDELDARGLREPAGDPDAALS